MDLASWLQRIRHELVKFLAVFLYVAPWFLAFSAYRMMLLQRFSDETWEFGTGLVNALILSKVILIGEYLRLGRRQENRPLFYSSLYKAFLFTLLAAAFHLLELAIRSLLHGEGIGGAMDALRGLGAKELLARSVVMFFAFVPFFALRETGRVLGEQRMTDLFFKRRAPAGPAA